mgnify:CR=1 FL=1
METLTISIPKKILSGRNSTRRLVVVDPKEFEKELRQQWEMKEAKQAVTEARKEIRNGTAREIRSVRELMR